MAVRQHPRFRVAGAPALRRALFRATPVLAAASIASGAPLVWPYRFVPWGRRARALGLALALGPLKSSRSWCDRTFDRFRGAPTWL